MNKNEKFILYWKPYHEKGVVRYTSRSLLIFSVVLILSILVFYLAFPLRRNNLIHAVQLDITLIIISTITKISDWFSKEKRYRTIIGENKNSD